MAGFLRSVADFGKNLGVAVRLRAQKPDFPRFTIPFGTNCLPNIVRRINVAIRRALLLEQRALQQAGLRPPPRDRARAAAATHAAWQDDAPPRPKRTTARRARTTIRTTPAGPAARSLPQTFAADRCRPCWQTSAAPSASRRTTRYGGRRARPSSPTAATPRT
ncbi:MAG TPA: hypothetical protein VGG99_18820 [Acetobacteraceae bacterium]